jgi:hypothetical protein
MHWGEIYGVILRLAFSKARRAPLTLQAITGVRGPALFTKGGRPKP